MRLSRVFLEGTFETGDRVELDARAARYVGQVLRLRPGQRLTLFNGDGNDWSAELLVCSRRDCRVRIIERLATEPPPRRALHLGIGLSRGDRMDVAIQKSVELGVSAITPLLTRRSVVQLDDERRARRLAHWRGVVIGACEQSGRSRLPDLHPVTPLDAWLAEHPGGLMLHHGATATLATLPPPTGDITLLIGPEGGLAESERRQAHAAHFIPVRLGPRVLRAETAPLAALAAVQILWGDFR